ncbi:hypothetical protein CPB84DRAFT_246482 [Gymnopilus junonius]|uniref:Uncharacterized protein n=1 Tax=Gymnopilus junonius TaxID=109634 RepID=A0A9P5NSW9_GYMJU|nr:hypothetical protein CPB84DRAFT_246482 [Gymnopilus junonius]
MSPIQEDLSDISVDVRQRALGNIEPSLSSQPSRQLPVRNLSGGRPLPLPANAPGPSTARLSPERLYSQSSLPQDHLAIVVRVCIHRIRVQGLLTNPDRYLLLPVLLSMDSRIHILVAINVQVQTILPLPITHPLLMNYFDMHLMKEVCQWMTLIASIGIHLSLPFLLEGVERQIP